MVEKNENQPSNESVAEQQPQPAEENGNASAVDSSDNVSEAATVAKDVVAVSDSAKSVEADRSDTLTAVNNVSEAEGQVQKMPYPKSVFFIIVNEFCERFNYYGVRTVLVLYLSRQLGYTDDSATIVFHTFSMFVYFTCIFGAIISDSWLGKFKTIFYLSLVYVSGSVMLTLGAVPPLELPAETFTMIGLSLIALGSGGIKPCVAAFGGDQFKLPEQVKQMTMYFSLFYFSINCGSLISTSITPILREDVHCFGQKECYSLAFGVPAMLMAVAILVFILGRPLYLSKPPAGNMVVLVSKTIGAAISTKWREHKTNPREHWLDYADQQYDKQLIADVKVLMRVLLLYVPLPFFWALFDQQGSRWTFQATRMDGDMGSWDIKPDQLQVLNPALILIFIPLYNIAFYPALSWCGIRRPLQKLTLGGILAGVAFVISGLVELKLEPTYPTLPTSHNAQIRIFNGNPCDYSIDTNIPGNYNFDVDQFGYYVHKDVPITSGEFLLTYSINAKNPSDSCSDLGSNTQILSSGKAYYLFLASNNKNTELIWNEDYVNKPSRSSPLGRTLANVQPGRNIKWELVKKGTLEHTELPYLHNLTEFSTGKYRILVDETEVTDITLANGGVYTVLISEISATSYRANVFQVTEPNSVNILWLIPQYFVMTLGEVMFSVTGLEFSYSQAPLSMKSVLQAFWLLTVAFGNVIVIIVAELQIFDSQAMEFFLFAGLMFIDMLIFMFLAYRYKPNYPMDVSESELEPLHDPKNEIPQLDMGVRNKGNDVVDE